MSRKFHPANWSRIHFLSKSLAKLVTPHFDFPLVYRYVEQGNCSFFSDRCSNIDKYYLLGRDNIELVIPREHFGMIPVHRPFAVHRLTASPELISKPLRQLYVTFEPTDISLTATAPFGMLFGSGHREPTAIEGRWDTPWRYVGVCGNSLSIAKMLTDTRHPEYTQH